MKHPIGRPPRVAEAVLLIPKVEGQSFKRGMVRGPYTNWFKPSLWGPIYAAVKCYRSIYHAWKYFKMMHKNPWESQGTYENLSRDSMYEWFTSREEFKDGFKQYVDEGSSHFQGGFQHYPILFRDDYCTSMEWGARSRELGFLILILKNSDNHGEGDLLLWIMKLWIF